MTATPRIYGDAAKATADKENTALCSMDDEELYGKELFVINFSEAVQRGLLVDYKVIVLTVDEAHVSSRLQNLLADENNSLKVDDAAKIIGCWKALSKQGAENDLMNTDPMRRAVAFCQVIEASNAKSKTHKVSSKQIASMFQNVVEAYQEKEEDHNTLICEANHVDGSMNATEKESKLEWLKAETPENTCRILSNVRCLSEGVDVPALDAVLFLTPRNSQVDVVQSVGRVMRKAEGKDLGYVILPVVIPTGMAPSEALNDNKTYKVVWEVLQALRSHDDRFDAMINKLDLIGKDNKKMEVISITDKVAKKSDSKRKKKKETGSGQHTIGSNVESQQQDQIALEFEVGEIERALYAKVVKKCGNRNHWTEWAKDIADIARTHITRINAIVNNPDNKKEVKAFTEFADELRDDLNDSITNEEVIEMLAQHLITKPVFDALFEEYSFASNNPVSLAMQHVLEVLQEHRLEKEADTLEKFYESVKMRAEGINNAEGKQKIVVELYDKFFRNAFPKMTERLGIVYTPVEVVDFIIHSVNNLLQQEFGQTLGSEGVHIIDPFTGTGTFITRLLQSGLISNEQLPKKYKNEIHANEIVLLAYYISAVNIEAVYHSIVGKDEIDYKPFEGICLTDTFQLYEKEDLISNHLADNSDRRKRQKALDIRVIMGNPPYSEGQNSENDNNDNVVYPYLDGRIRATYAEKSDATLFKGLYNSYVRAIRWASDRLGDSGIIGFVTNGGFIDANFSDGLRRCLNEEFSDIYIFHLRGNQRTSGELSRKEGGKIFDSGSRAPIAISFLVKNQLKTNGNIHFYDIGDYLSRDQKLEKINEFYSISGITDQNGWQIIKPDVHGDWINQRDDSFSKHIVVTDKKDAEVGIFQHSSLGLITNRDPWCFNYSKPTLSKNMSNMIDFYNQERIKFTKEHLDLDKKEKKAIIDGVINMDRTKISWTRSLKQSVVNDKDYEFNPDSFVTCLYRPFTKQWLYFNRQFNEMISKVPRLFPTPKQENLVICVSGPGCNTGFTALISDMPMELCISAMKGGSHCLPLYSYDEVKIKGEKEPQDLFSEEKETNDSFVRYDGISDSGLVHFQNAYPEIALTKEDIFYYIYGLLHSTEYRDRYADNLTKELPRIPCVKQAKDFWAFSKAGRDLAELHLNYETVKPYKVTLDKGTKKLTEEDYYVTKMKFAKTKVDGKNVNDKSTVIYNAHITMTDIPLEAYDYVVNGKPALEWVMERQAVTTDKKSGIVNDANDWAIETMGNAKYPLELFQRVITVSLETMKIVNSLPALDID